MLTVNQREQICRAYSLEGHGIRRIAREGHHDRGTLRKALQDAGPPHYTLHQPRVRPVLGPLVQLIQRWLFVDTSRPPKQRHTAHRIYHRPIEEYSFSGKESTRRPGRAYASTCESNGPTR